MIQIFRLDLDRAPRQPAGYARLIGVYAGEYGRRSVVILELTLVLRLRAHPIYLKFVGVVTFCAKIQVLNLDQWHIV